MPCFSIGLMEKKNKCVLLYYNTLPITDKEKKKHIKKFISQSQNSAMWIAWLPLKFH